MAAQVPDKQCIRSTAVLPDGGTSPSGTAGRDPGDHRPGAVSNQVGRRLHHWWEPRPRGGVCLLGAAHVELGGLVAVAQVPLVSDRDEHARDCPVPAGGSRSAMPTASSSQASPSGSRTTGNGIGRVKSPTGSVPPNTSSRVA